MIDEIKNLKIVTILSIIIVTKTKQRKRKVIWSPTLFCKCLNNNKDNYFPKLIDRHFNIYTPLNKKKV